MSTWPYPSYSDRRWLGGDRGSDRALATVVRALRSLVTETGGSADAAPDSLLHALTQLADLGGTIIPGSPADFGRLIASEIEKWAKVIKFANIKPE